MCICFMGDYLYLSSFETSSADVMLEACMFSSVRSSSKTWHAANCLQLILFFSLKRPVLQSEDFVYLVIFASLIMGMIL